MKIKNFIAGLHTLVQLSAALAIAVFAYLIFREFHYRFDLSEGSIYSFSPQTIRVLEEHKNEPITVTAFFRDEQPARYQVQVLLKQYASAHPNLSFTFYDPDRMPSLADQYGIDAYGITVVEANHQREKLRIVNEQTITNTLVKLFLNDPKVIAFASEHDVSRFSDLQSPDGFGLLQKTIVDANYRVTEVSLMKDRIPQDADMLAVIGFRGDLLPKEVETIRDYLSLGGKLLFLQDPVDIGEGKETEQFLGGVGIELGSNVVVDKLSKLFGGDYLIPLITDYASHDITSDFQIATFFPIARTVRKQDATLPSAWKVENLLLTGPGTWAEGDLNTLEEGVTSYDESQDILGPVSLAVAAQQANGSGSRLVVVGDSDFVNNSYLKLAGNRDLVLNMVSWLVGDDYLISIRPKERFKQPLFLTEKQQALLFYALILTPFFACLLIGGIVTLLRRKHQ